ncbi:hypothetical protein FA15DRAFT_675812 [Coprinopsis marcescibilis]|uniref:Uncharacterized protein n=1 Tax=Coprinopsis marcescibilis TaxID=230819 RepID=A0A5C3KCZ7_COPMA|nr:hypothetical protein FA15DRAFT_675812 [Coprinopsis marcescibilis]
MAVRVVFCDSFDLQDIVKDSKSTLGGEGVDYCTFGTAGGRCRSMHTGGHEWGW